MDGRDTACIATLIGTDKANGKGKDKDKSTNRSNGPEQTQGRHTCLPPALPQERLFAYDDWRLLGEYTPDGTPVQETVWFGDLPVATVQTGEIYYVHADHLGTPRVITEPDTATEVWRWDSDPSVLLQLMKTRMGMVGSWRTICGFRGSILMRRRAYITTTLGIMHQSWDDIFSLIRLDC